MYQYYAKRKKRENKNKKNYIFIFACKVVVEILVKKKRLKRTFLSKFQRQVGLSICSKFIRRKNSNFYEKQT